VNEALDLICQKALAFEPDKRYPTAAALQEDLESYIADHEKRPSPRQVGSFVNSLFHDQQENARKLIQSQLTELLNSRRSIITIDVEPDEPPPSGTMRMPDSGETPSAVTHSDGLQMTRSELSAVGRGRRSSSRLYVLIAVGVAALVVAAVGTWNAVTTPGPAPATPDTAEITLTLRATPLEAHFTVDDGPTLENPYAGRVHRDNKLHHISAAASGFSGKTEDVLFDRDVSIRFALGHGGDQ
jgi:serine/threonine-protein kinase